MKHPKSASHAGAAKIAIAALGITGAIAGASLFVVSWGSVASRSNARPVAASADRFVTSEMARSDGSASVIIRLSTKDGRLGERHRAEIAAMDAAVVHEFPSIDSVALRLPRRNLMRLAHASWASHLSSDSRVEKTDEFTQIASGAAAAYAQFGASSLTGSGVTVAVVDSGVQSVEDLKSLKSDGSPDQLRVRRTVDYVEDGNTSPKDASGHGTHVAGVIAGSGYMSADPAKYYRTFRGVAHKASIVNVRVLDELGAGDVSDVLAGLEWVIANKSSLNIRVVNLSLGHKVGESYVTDPLCRMVERVWKAGIVVVCAAGNNGRGQATKSSALDNGGYGTDYGSVHSPGNSPYVITVGAMRRRVLGLTPYTASERANDQVASYSSRGPSSGDLILKPDLVAPGDRIVSLGASSGYLFDNTKTNYLQEGRYTIGKAIDNNRSNQYFVLSGTSIAAPVVAGAAALMIQRDPTLTPDTVKARLMLTADKWVGTDYRSDPFTFGAGYVNVKAALNSTVKAQGFALSPFVSLGSDGTLRIGQHSSVWTGGTFWGTGITNLQAVWGRAVYPNAIVDDSKNLTGRVYEVQGDQIMWGSGTGSTKRTATLLNTTSIGGDQ